MPATCCGVFGLKPTYGRVSRKGVYPPSSSLDCVGPFANSVEMIEKAMQIIDPTFKPTEFTRTPKIAVLDVKADEVVWNCIHQALQKANLQITSEKLNILKPLMTQACRLLIMKIGKLLVS